MSDNIVDPKQYSAATDQCVLELIVAEADKRVQVQVQLMLAADTRANGILAGCVTLAAGGIGYSLSKYNDPKSISIFWSALVFGLFEMSAAIFALSSLWPTSIKPQGWSPASFKTDILKTKSAVLGELAALLQKRIEDNRKCMRALSRRIKASMLLAVNGPMWGLVVGLFSSGKYILANSIGAFLIIFGIVFGVPLALDVEPD